MELAAGLRRGRFPFPSARRGRDVIRLYGHERGCQVSTLERIGGVDLLTEK